MGVADELFSVGDTKDIVVGSETLTTEIVGFNHDPLAEGGGYAPMTFGLKNLMATTAPMNATNSNVGGYWESDMHKDTLGTQIFLSLPGELYGVMKLVNKNASAGNMAATIETQATKIFLFSVNEVAGTQSGSWVSNNEGSQYPVFSSDGSRVKKLSNGAGAAQWWWLRSPRLRYSTSFCGVGSAGNATTTDDASDSGGVCFGFCI